MEINNLSGQETVPATQYGSSLQVSGESNLLSQNSVQFLAGEKDVSGSEDDVSVSEDDVSVSNFDEEEEDIGNDDDSLETEDVDASKVSNENEQKDELCSGMEFCSADAAYTAYRKYGGSHGFDIRKYRTSTRNGKLVRFVYVCSKEGLRKEHLVKKSFQKPVTRCGCKARMSCFLQKNGRYKITTFDPKHNHDLVKTPM